MPTEQLERDPVLRPGERMEDHLFFSERIWPCHAGGCWWRVEAISFRPDGSLGFRKVAIDRASVKWLARRKINSYKRRLTRLAREVDGSERG